MGVENMEGSGNQYKFFYTNYLLDKCSNLM